MKKGLLKAGVLLLLLRQRWEEQQRSSTGKKLWERDRWRKRVFRFCIWKYLIQR